ncbi:unnamed protein product [Closterium sp. NIES-54]
MATPSVLTFDAEGQAVDFEVWVDDLLFFLQCDRSDGLSLFDLTSGASPAPAADADATVRSQWATRDGAARLAVRRHLPTAERVHFSQYKSAKTLYDAVVARYSSPATAALSRLILPYLFPDLAAFPIVADLITHLRTSDTRYRAALPAEFCAKNPPPMYITLYYIVTRLPDSLRLVRDHFLRGVGFPDATEIPRWGELFRVGVAIFDLDYDAILAAMHAVTISDEGDCYLCVPPDPGIEAAALGTGEAAALGASASATPGAGESALSGTSSAQAFHTFTLDSGASRSFFRDRTTLTPLSRPVVVSLADPSRGPVLAHFSTILPCPAAPSGTLSGLYLPSFSTNLVSGADLQDAGIHQRPPFYILVYVDDLVFATADAAGLAHVKSELQKRDTCTDLGELRSYLGLEITRDRARRTITLTQSHMVQQVLQRFDFTYSSPQATPLSTRHLLSALPSDESVELSGLYLELVGCLISSCEAEIYAGAMAAQELRWLTYLLTDLGEPPRSPPILYVDNKAMLALCREHRLEHRTKHIALRYFLARELQQRGQLRLAYVASEANTADIFTKGLAPCDHQRFCTLLGLVPTLPHLLTS